MKIKLVKILKPLSLADYSPQLAEAVLQIWVNMPRAFAARHNAALLADEVLTLAWYAEWLSQADDPETHWTADELQEISETDPALWDWIVIRAWALVDDYRADMLKKPIGSSAAI